MSFWIHCNNCYRQPDSSTEVRFYLTNCSHLFCETCVPQCPKEQCKVCKSQCSTLLLSGKMPKDIDGIFKDPMESIQKLFKQLHQIMEFQKGQQRRLVRHMRAKIKFHDQQVEQMKNVLKQARALERENIQLKRQNQYLSTVAKKDSPYRTFNQQAQKMADSPYRTFNQQAQKMASPSDFPFTMMGGSGRLLLRTPPSGGRMGTGSTGSAYSQGRQSDTPCSTGTPSSFARSLVQLFSD